MQLLDNEERKALNKIFPDKSEREMFAIHYIISRIEMCSFMCIPDPDKKYFPYQESYQNYLKHYEEHVKPNLTEEIIEAICDYNGFGFDIINKGNKGYNLPKIFNYHSCNEWSVCDKTDAYFEYKKPELPLGPVALDMIRWQFEESILPYICKEKEDM